MKSRKKTGTQRIVCIYRDFDSSREKKKKLQKKTTLDNTWKINTFCTILFLQWWCQLTGAIQYFDSLRFYNTDTRKNRLSATDDKLEATWLLTKFLKLVLKSIHQVQILTIDERSAIHSRSYMSVHEKNAKASIVLKYRCVWIWRQQSSGKCK